MMINDVMFAPLVLDMPTFVFIESCPWPIESSFHAPEGGLYVEGIDERLL